MTKSHGDEEVLRAVKREIADLCGVDEATIVDDGKLVGYGLDSVRALDLIVAMEDEFDVEISEHDPELAKLKTVRELAAFVARKRGSG